MRKHVVVCLLVVVVLAALAGVSLLGPALAAPGTLLSDAPVLGAPNPEAASVGWLPAGSAVSVDGPPVDGFYPVTAEDVSGWLPAASLLLDQATGSGASIAAATPVAGDAPVTDLSSGTATAAPGLFPEAGPSGPATVAIEAPILAGPGPGFGLIATAPAGSTVEQTGKLIGGYVTVQYAEVTGWAPLDHLGAPPSDPD
ncbi:MAG: hypothetical protein K0S78_3887 [Thermomicrobiales bacterium]|nr:hypothetical protein [Thermomicrobiales bacterium]MDF3041267.1 hypothetical protein [Thermomicrobiales bacterium]